MNKIEIFKPFSEAVELTKKILFRPFDLAKWFTIGFAAFLAHLGGGYNFNYSWNQRGTAQEQAALQQLKDFVHQIPPWLIISGAIFLAVLILGLTILFAWLRARGRFMFVDCIVKNRGAIVDPWREFRKEGNSYFLFSLLVALGFLTLGGLLALPFLLPIIRHVTFLHLHDVYLISMIALWAVSIFLLATAWVLVSHFMIAVMYRRRCRAYEGCRAVLSLIATYPGEITLYCLFCIALFIGTAFVACVLVCATCCLAALPYIGTVILLPVYVCLWAFTLLFLRQFGSDYDVWFNLPQPGPPPLPA
jgi:hypothetical protein